MKLSELHPFHTLRDHPFKVQDDKAMDDLVGTIKEHGIMTVSYTHLLKAQARFSHAEPEAVIKEILETVKVPAGVSL